MSSLSAENEAKGQATSARGEELRFIATLARGVNPIVRNDIPVNPDGSVRERKVQSRIIEQALQKENSVQPLMDEIFVGPFAQGLTRQELLMEYTTVQLAREFALRERIMHRAGQLDFYIHSAGIEVAQIAVQRHVDNNDAYLPYYRAQAADLYRGGELSDLFAQDLHRTGDSHSGGRQLAGHMSSAKRGEVTATSITGAHWLPAVGIGTALNDRLTRRDATSYERFTKPDAIAIAEIGEASMAQGEVMEAVSQAVKDESAVVFVVYNNLAGISMDLSDSSINDDPILFARSFNNEPTEGTSKKRGLQIREVDGTDLDALMETARETVEYTRQERKPSLLLINNLPRVTDHSSSSHQEWFTMPEELARRKGFDVLEQYKTKLVGMGVASLEELAAIESFAHKEAATTAEEVFARPSEDPKKLYDHVYSPAFHYGPLVISNNPAVPPIDHLQSTRTHGVLYTDKSHKEIEISGRMYVNTVLAEEMARDPRIVVYGEDVGTMTSGQWRQLPKYFDQRVEQKRDSLNPEVIDRASRVIDLVQKGKGSHANPEDLAAFAQVMDGKGGVFRATQYLDVLFGRDRAFNFPIREAGMVGTGIGRAIAGELPVIELQFDPYTSPGYPQLHDYLSNFRWRGAGNFYAGVVFRVAGMNRVGGDGIHKAGGIGGIGHGAADVSRFLVPGIRHFIPGDVEDMGAGLREAIRVAREYKDPVIVHEPINFYNAKGYYQGPDQHIPLGEAEVRRSGNDLVFLSWSNNVPVADAAARTLDERGYDVGVVNLRSIGDQLDWQTVIPEVGRANKVMIFEAGRKDGAMVAAQIQQQLFEQLDGPVALYSARHIPMPAGETNEGFTVPQYEDVVEHAKALINY